VYRDPQMDRVRVERNVVYATRESSPLCLDVYLPPGESSGPVPGVVLVTGYSDIGARQHLGCTFKEMVAYVDWARLIAANGLAAITYENANPIEDVRLVFEYLREHGEAYGIDASAMCVWSCSGNVPAALATIAGQCAVKAAVLCYGYTLDFDDHDDVANAAAQFQFVTGSRRVVLDDLMHASILLVPAGLDEMPGLNASMDRFISRATEGGLPLTVLRHETGPHAFDLFDDSAETRRIVREILGFMRVQLTPAGQGD